MKLALMLGGMAAGRQLGGPSQVLAQGAKLLGQSPELGRLTDEIRGRLLEAGKGAAVAVATRQVEALTDRLVTQLGTTTEAGERTVSDVSERAGEAGRTVSGLGRRRSREETGSDSYEEEESDQYDEEESGRYEEEPEDRIDEEPAAEEEVPEAEAEPPEAEEEVEGAEAEEDEAEEDQAEEDQAEEEPPSPPRRRAPRTGAAGRRTPDATGRNTGSARTTRQTAGERAGRPARGRQGRSDG
jgi:hypothetical protein